MSRDGRTWARVRLAVLERDEYRCTADGCGRAGRLEVHHKVAGQSLRRDLKAGAFAPVGRLATLCRSCHIEIHKAPMTEAASRWRSLVDALA